MKREEVIAGIEKLRGHEVHPKRIEDIGQRLMEFRYQRVNEWQTGWTRKALIGCMFGPIVVFALFSRSWNRLATSGFSIWWVPAWIVSTIILSWVYVRLGPKFGTDRFGLHRKCVGCKYSLKGLESVLGDQLWVGPAVCPECGQDYPAISE